MSDRYLIVNADDLGLCPEVNEGILETVQDGIVTSVSLFVNPPHDADLGPFLAAGVSIGLHVSLTQGVPCARPDDVPSLLGPSSRLDPKGHERVATFGRDDVRRELDAQLECFRKRVGRDPTHLDVHKHLHRRDERFLSWIIQAAGGFGVPLRTTNDAMRTACRAAGVATADRFVGDVRPAPYWTIERLCSTLAALRHGLTELMCHPGRNVGPVDGLWYLAERDAERQALISPQARQAAAALRLVDFRTAPL